ncbi:MAG: glycosyl transferase, partial [Cyanobacteria bacterium P01_A01_bin.37]
RLGTPIVSIERDGFAESTFLLDGIRHYAHHQILKPSQLFDGTWDFLHHPMCPPKQESSRMAQNLATNGNEAIARAVIDYLT